MKVDEIKQMAAELDSYAVAIFKNWYENASPIEQLRLAEDYPILYAEYVENQAGTAAHQC